MVSAGSVFSVSLGCKWWMSDQCFLKWICGGSLFSKVQELFVHAETSVMAILGLQLIIICIIKQSVRH